MDNKEFEDKTIKIRTNLRFVSEIKLLEADFDSLSIGQKKNRLILEQNKSCNKCKLSDWLGQPITLELEHIDGDTNNNKKNNLEVLCPNCHSQTSTWRGKNRKDKINKIKLTGEDYVKSFLECKNVRQALLAMNTTAKGKSYQIMYKYLDLYNIPYIKQSRLNRLEKSYMA